MGTVPSALAREHGVGPVDGDRPLGLAREHGVGLVDGDRPLSLGARTRRGTDGWGQAPWPWRENTAWDRWMGTDPLASAREHGVGSVDGDRPLGLGARTWLGIGEWRQTLDFGDLLSLAC